jgi:diaminopimelate epimerase
MQFRKYQGLGNDFILIDARRTESPPVHPDQARLLCDRRFGVGADGLILALPPEGMGDVRMQIINADGTEAEMCGNGVRCFARFLADLDGASASGSWRVETPAGIIVPQLLADQQVSVDMGEPFLSPSAIPTSIDSGGSLAQAWLEVAGEQLLVAAVGMGNPHAVVQVDDLDLISFTELGTALETHPAFPARTNVHFVQVISQNQLRMKVWERGAGATLACGTGACAVLVASHLRGACAREADIELPGGILHICWDEENHLQMVGPAEFVFSGNWFLEEDAKLLTTKPIDCSIDCSQGCLDPDNCPSATARANAMALLDKFSLNQLVDLANESVEQRTIKRIKGG